MMADGDWAKATGMAGAAAVVGAAARVLILLHGGVRRWHLLLIEAGVGALLGVMAAGAAVWWDPALRDMGWPLLIVSSVAGCAGAIGTRLLDVVIAAAEKRAGL